jgi:uncharacterized membrane protein YfcA
MIFTIIANIYILMGGDMPFDVEMASDNVMMLINAVAGFWIYFERVTGEMKLVLPWRTQLKKE